MCSGMVPIVVMHATLHTQHYFSHLNRISNVFMDCYGSLGEKDQITIV